jgi:hypothetical protein
MTMPRLLAASLLIAACALPMAAQSNGTPAIASVSGGSSCPVDDVENGCKMAESDVN